MSAIGLMLLALGGASAVFSRWLTNRSIRNVPADERDKWSRVSLIYFRGHGLLLMLAGLLLLIIASRR